MNKPQKSKPIVLALALLSLSQSLFATGATNATIFKTEIAPEKGVTLYPTTPTQTVKNPDGSSIQITADGTRIITHEDGSSITKKPDGTELVKNVDGSTILTRPDGTKIVVYKDGHSMEYFADGSHRLTTKDGSSIQTNSDGSITILKNNQLPR